MTVTIAWTAYALWMLVCAAQCATAAFCRLRFPVLFWYLVGEVALSCVGLPASHFLSAKQFMRVFFFAGYCDDALTIMLVIDCFNRIRRRARKKYQGALLATILLAASFGVALHFSAGTSPGTWASYGVAFVVSHLLWTWLGVFFAGIPAYSAAAGAYPDRPLFLLLTGMGLYLAVHAGVIDYIAGSNFNHSRLAGLASDVAYLCTLALWSAACFVAKSHATFCQNMTREGVTQR